MGRIQILPDTVANQIAAGEVVERPASVVKELLENSLDAGASRVTIEVAGGGKRLVRVADDGCGMLRDDALLAFERHATSKLKEARELSRIATLGFRGEALPSIASVSRLVLETRSVEEPTGTRVEFAGGKLLGAEEVALPPGTTVTVRDLFFNVPARRKFLRSDQTELAHIGRLVTHYSLAHPEKSFLLRSEGGELLNVAPVERLGERVYQIFGRELLEELVDLGDRQRGLEVSETDSRNFQHRLEAEKEKRAIVFKLSGFVSRPQYQKLNQSSVYLFVNKRPVRDRLLMHALSEAYYNLMPSGCYPFAVLLLECDFSEVDVNVHPTKAEVRFRHASFVHDFVREAIREALTAARPVGAAARMKVLGPSMGSPQQAPTLPLSEFSQRAEDQPWFERPVPVIPAIEQWRRAGKEPPLRGMDTAAQALWAQPVSGRVPETHSELPVAFPDAVPAGQEELAGLRILGQLHDSFIVAAGTEGLYIIDQHVAHERILFEKLLKNWGQGVKGQQKLLLPLVIRLNPTQQVEYARIAGELEAAGFEIEPFGRGTIAVKAIPAELEAASAEKVIYEILDVAESELRGLSLGEQRRVLAAAIACRSAIKVNTKLNEAEMRWLLDELAGTAYPMSCPHGRPVVLRYGMREILRDFGRI